MGKFVRLHNISCGKLTSCQSCVMASQPGGHCYCGAPEIPTPYYFLCDMCKRKFHEECLKTSAVSVLKGDFMFQFRCTVCAGGEEEFTRTRLQWIHVVHLALYNLQLAGSGMCGYFRWKEHICTFIDKHWATFFGSHRKKTSLWHGTVAGVLSSGCPGIFISGAQELKETGWWRLAETKPPNPHKIATPVSKPASRKKETPSPTEPPKEGLRSRRGKTSIQAAMELKAKRATLMEAKEIRKTKLARREGDRSATTPSPSPSSGSSSSQVPQSLLTEHLPLSTPVLHSPIKQESAPSLTFTGMFPSGDAPVFSGVPATPTGSVGTGTLVSPCSSSLHDFSDENSNVSQSSYLTEKDLKLQSTVPNLLLSEDVGGHEGDDSDFEIDPGTLSPAPPGSPIRMQDSPTVQEMLSAIDSHSSVSQMLLEDSSNLGSSLHDSSYQESISMDTSLHDNASCYSNSNHGDNSHFFRNFSMDGSQMDRSEQSKDDGEEASVVDSESDSDSDSDVDRQVDGHAGTASTGRKRKLNTEDKEPETAAPEPKCLLMSMYEERLLLKKLEAAAERAPLPPHVNRFKRKLLVRQLKREHGLPVFDLDAEMNRLAQVAWGVHANTRDQHQLIPGDCYHGDMRVLDKFQTQTYNKTRLQQQQQPSFLNRLVGYEDDQLHCIRSPYTARILKPFIRRDYESRPLKLQLLEEIKAYPHRHDSSWTPDPSPSIDYCYVRPQHIPSVNTLCREFFWPGLDLSECLQYPDFSCVVLFRKIVIGFAFMVPDVKQNEAYISFIFTHPEWRRANIATFMLYHLIQTCMGKDVTLHCSATNTAMLLYQKFGFKPEEFILDFYDKYFPADTRECKHAFLLRLRR
ncbi:cysteine-rich protein 2-binding protein-like isoform X2 [Mya arenaria]|uniref:cysteine-rich protein 2-binding protein-like isoform X2 n=2 Tax=Mya arenaria TaxID=6604 RepID=UPI0022E544ED|nr:cysteine-rich protein 2-binding protein-like isoform X2 [Mya arenaria]